MLIVQRWWIVCITWSQWMLLVEDGIGVLTTRERKRQGVGCPAFYFSLICCTNITNEFWALRVYDIQDFLLQKILCIIIVFEDTDLIGRG